MLFNSLWKQTNITCFTVNVTNYCKLELLNRMNEIALTNKIRAVIL